MTSELKLIALLLAFAGVFGIGCRYGLNAKQGEWDAAVKAESESKDKALQAAAQRVIRPSYQTSGKCGRVCECACAHA